MRKLRNNRTFIKPILQSDSVGVITYTDYQALAVKVLQNCNTYIGLIANSTLKICSTSDFDIS